MSRAPTPLLEVRNLTLRFRGLTAVDRVDLTVGRGEIAAVIGPNGAGKTSLFNAITGIYQPTSGTVSFDGRDLCEPLTRRHVVRWAFLGAAVGLFVFLLALDVDRMWATVVRQNYAGARGFPFSQATRDLVSYIKAEPPLEKRLGRFDVTTFDGRVSFGSSRTRAEAQARREAVIAMAQAPAEITAQGDDFIVRSAGVELDRSADRAILEERLQAAHDLPGVSRSILVKRFVFLILGLMLGVTGGFVIWRRSRRTPFSVASRGIARTFQNIRLFQDMTVLENVLVGFDRQSDGAPIRRRAGLGSLGYPVGVAGLCLVLSGLTRMSAPESVQAAVFFIFGLSLVAYIAFVGRVGAFARADLVRESVAIEQAMRLLAKVGLNLRANEVAKNLAYGDQRRLEIARALATQPQLLLLDEPAAGMNPSESKGLMRLIRAIRDDGVTILLIEHHMRVVMGISDRIMVLVHGQKIADGVPGAIRSDPRVVEAYLGTEDIG